MKKILPLILGVFILLSGCSNLIAAPTPTSTPTIADTDTPTPLPPTGTATGTPTFTASPTFTSSPVPTATWVVQGPGAIKVPILLYHRIAVSPIDSRYYVAPEKFEEQMKLLYNWGYQTIKIEMLIKAITEGAELPPRPVIISFDDGHLDNYTTALPILQKYGFTGVEYIVYNYMGTDGYMTVDQIKELAAQGWEIGSHSVNHLDLTRLEPAVQRAEIVESRKKLQKALGLPISTFAYPFGSISEGAIDYVHFAGYVAAMSANGFTADQGKGNLFSLQRCEIKGTEDAKTFIRFLPWHGDPAFLPTDTPVPTGTPSRTPKP